MSAIDELRSRLTKIKEVYDVDYLLALKTDPNLKNSVEHKVTYTPYSLFHIGNKSEKQEEDKTLSASAFIEPFIEKNPVKQALELGAGMNGDGLYLAMRHPHVYFYRVTSFQSKLEYEVTAYRGLKNYKTFYGSFDNLAGFHPDSMDITFSVESLSLFPKRRDAMSEVNRVLNRGGFFIVVDGYLGQSELTLSKDELITRHLVGRGRSLKEFQTYDNFRDATQTTGFTIEDELDVTDRAFSSLEKYEKEAARFFEHPGIAKLLSKIKDTDYAYTMISNYLMPVAVDLGMARYIVTVLRKQ